MALRNMKTVKFRLNKLIKKVNLQNVSLRAQVDNPFYWASNGEGIDPESFNANAGTRTELLMPTYSLGLNINC